MRDSIEAALTAEENSRTVLKIYMNRFFSDSVFIDSSDFDLLYNVAIQCPSVGGTAVYQARVMLNFFDDGMQDYADYCENEPINWPQLRTEDDEAISVGDIDVFPNPAKDEIKISYSGLMSHSSFEILDVSGRKLMEVKLNDTIGAQTISVFNLSSGVYFYRVQFEDGTYRCNKLTVVK